MSYLRCLDGPYAGQTHFVPYGVDEVALAFPPLGSERYRVAREGEVPQLMWAPVVLAADGGVWRATIGPADDGTWCVEFRDGRKGSVRVVTHERPTGSSELATLFGKRLDETP